MVVGGEIIYIGPLHRPVVDGLQVAGHANMRGGIGPVGCQAYFDYIVGFGLKIFGSRGTRGYLFLQHNDALVAAAQAYLIFGTDHALRYFASYLRFLYLERLTSGRVQGGARQRYHYGLPSGHVGCSAYDWGRLFRPYIYGSNLEFIGIGVLFAGKHLADNQSLQAALDGLDFFQTFYLQPCSGEHLTYFGRRFGQVDVLFKPIE